MKTESTITDNERRERLIATWERCFILTQKTERNFNKRLLELETWDTLNDKFERECKIEALKNLLNK